MSANPHLGMPELAAPPRALTCECGLRHIVSVDAALAREVGDRMLLKSAAGARWRCMDRQWLCPRCFAGRVHQASLQGRVGSNHAMHAIHRAEQDRHRLLQPDGWRP